MRSAFFTFMVLLILSAGVTKAQITVGSSISPQSFSVLEMISNGERGLRLPQLTGAQRETLTAQLKSLTVANAAKAEGLQIFNTTTFCVETWNGTKWIASCADNPDPWIEIPLPDPGCNEPVPPVRFARSNLGADPALNTPKKQLEYLATHPFDPEDARVYGGHFQWGRKDHEHTLDGTSFRRYSVTEDPVSVYTPENGWEWTWDGGGGNKTAIDVNGQPDGDAAGKFVYGDYLIDNEWNWYPDLTSVQADTLWGNGYPTNYDFLTADGGSIPYTNTFGILGYYQKPHKTINDPCPAGFRVPTQDEWERLGNYDCNPSFAETNGATSNINGVVTPVNSDPTVESFMWVPVVCSNSTGKCVPNKDWSILSGQETASGYVIYTKYVWENAGSEYKKIDGTGRSLHEASAPEPVIFLPSAGLRDNVSSGPTLATGLDGRYWSSTIAIGSINSQPVDVSYALYFTSDYIFTNGAGYRCAGLSVRCVAE
ncbi:MAG: hypothetical protein LBS54_02410 [Dysgonamonadaceae bacterium]|jgi:hypothetical protein|nr:hypothetical protein [Dysgonamonadaceae bacterium]